MKYSSSMPQDNSFRPGSIAAFRARVNSRRRRRGLGGLWIFAVFSWAALTMVQVMQSIALTTPIPTAAGSSLPVFPVFQGLAIWVAVSLGGLVVALFRKKAFRRTFFSFRGLFPTLIALFVGAFMGTNIFTLTFVDSLAQSTFVAVGDFPRVEKQMVLFRAATPQEQKHWFDDAGALRPELQEKWCANALPRAQTFADMSTNPSGAGIEVNALLSQALFAQVYALGCITDVELLDYQNKLHAAAQVASRQQTIMERMSSFAPILYVAAQAHPLIVERTVFSPQRVCRSLGGTSLAAVDLNALCNTFPGNRPTTKEELPGIQARLLAAKAK